MAVKFTNNASSTLVGAINSSQLSLQVANGGLFPAITAGSGNWFPITVVKATGGFEIMRCISRSGNVLGIDRAEEGTTAQAFANGDKVDLRMTAGAITAALTDLENEFNSDIAAMQASLTTSINAKPTGGVITRLITSQATWVRPVGLKSLTVTICGGGGGGGGCPATVAGTHVASGGGGAGGHGVRNFMIGEITVGSTVMQVGQGGVGATDGTGGYGGTTTFWVMSATGGEGGQRSPTVTTAQGPMHGYGGPGGVGGGCNLNLYGDNGGNGMANVERAVYSQSGAGGASPYGRAPKWYWSQHLVGENAVGFGSGGGGACNSNAQGANAKGGHGAPGFVLITERY